MTYTNNPTGTGTQTSTKTFQPADIKKLVQSQGKAMIHDKEFVLKSPAATDHNLQEIVKDPSFSVKPVGGTAANGACEYELSAKGKSVKIKVDCNSCH
jgi:hypothetical protein